MSNVRLAVSFTSCMILTMLIWLSQQPPAPSWAFDEKPHAVETEEVQPTLPVPKMVLPCEVVNVHDGDTMTVKMSVVVNVRLLDCWSSELKDPGGVEAREHLKELAPVGSKGVISIPLSDNLSKNWTFGRLLARVALPKIGDLSEKQVSDGHARKTKP